MSVRAQLAEDAIRGYLLDKAPAADLDAWTDDIMDIVREHLTVELLATAPAAAGVCPEPLCTRPEGHITPHGQWLMSEQAYREWDR